MENSVCHTWHVVEYSCVLIFMKKRKEGKQKGRKEVRKERGKQGRKRRRKEGKKEGRGRKAEGRKEESTRLMCFVQSCCSANRNLPACFCRFQVEHNKYIIRPSIRITLSETD